MYAIVPLNVLHDLMIDGALFHILAASYIKLSFPALDLADSFQCLWLPGLKTISDLLG